MNNLSISLQKVFSKKTNFFYKNKAFLVFSFLFFTSFLSFGQTTSSLKNNTCKSQLTIVDGVNKKVTNSIGTSFRLALKNKGSESMEYTISIQPPVYNRKDGNTKNRNTILIPRFFEYKTNTSKKFDFVKKSENQYQVRIAPNEVFTFIVELINPKGVKNGAKNATEIIVTADKCKKTPIKTVLYTVVKKSTTRQF